MLQPARLGMGITKPRKLKHAPLGFGIQLGPYVLTSGCIVNGKLSI